MLNEILTRIDVAYDQALTAAVVGPVDALAVEEREALGTAIDTLKAIVAAHEQENEMWVVTHEPIPGVRSTARVFATETEAYRFVDSLPSGVESLTQAAPYRSWDI